MSERQGSARVCPKKQAFGRMIHRAFSLSFEHISSQHIFISKREHPSD
jgi:hypothetical protein